LVKGLKADVSGFEKNAFSPSFGKGTEKDIVLFKENTFSLSFKGEGDLKRERLIDLIRLS